MSEKTQAGQSPYAVAIKYQSLSELPSVLAHGQGEIARMMVQIAREHDIPVVQDKKTVSTLNLSSIAGKVNDESFELVAELFAFLYFCDEKWRAKHSFLAPVMK